MARFTAVHRERLKLLADKLRSLTPKQAKHFNMNRWYGHKGKDEHPQPSAKPTMKDFMHCGTAGCALGWACTIPEFQELGLRLKHDEKCQIDGYLIPRYKGADRFDAAAKLFGLDYATADWLFTEADGVICGTETPLQVAKRIDTVIANRGKAPQLSGDGE